MIYKKLQNIYNSKVKTLVLLLLFGNVLFTNAVNAQVVIGNEIKFDENQADDFLLLNYNQYFSMNVKVSYDLTACSSVQSIKAEIIFPASFNTSAVSLSQTTIAVLTRDPLNFNRLFVTLTPPADKKPAGSTVFTLANIITPNHDCNPTSLSVAGKLFTCDPSSSISVATANFTMTNNDGIGVAEYGLNEPQEDLCDGKYPIRRFV
ncbi:MAG: hypothetical protein NT150_01865 [Bacteroidetes bacterium]|nr:hypothetical protein [Bacteroidota bacterium]